MVGIYIKWNRIKYVRCRYRYTSRYRRILPIYLEYYYYYWSQINVQSLYFPVITAPHSRQYHSTSSHHSIKCQIRTTVWYLAIDKIKQAHTQYDRELNRSQIKSSQIKSSQIKSSPITSNQAVDEKGRVDWVGW